MLIGILTTRIIPYLQRPYILLGEKPINTNTKSGVDKYYLGG